jgi:Domain of unknown function (DUF5916)/Carbohydrate family 9 binding domain-like
MIKFFSLLLKNALIGLLLLTAFTGHAQVPKILNVGFVNENVTIDGRLDEPCWKNADKAFGFTQLSPHPGDTSTQKTEVAVMYDNNAIYVGAVMYDNHPDSILTQLAARDNYNNNNDYFSVVFDTYNDHQNATVFIVTAAGVQADGILKFDGMDLSWNAPWYSKVTINDKGWCVEMKIPYASLRFPKKSVQEWGINFQRSIRRIRENSYWNEVKPGVSNILAQAGILKGIKDIVAPLRLSLLPYVSGYVQNTSGLTTQSLDGGMDIKYGINESFTLDMTLIPDFGQTIYDNKVLNLSPVEVRYADNRYFFTEGLSLFNKNDLFYTRRVGGTPLNYSNVSNLLDTNEVIKTNPSMTNLYNAVKISGRTKDNLGIGFFNAVAAPVDATVTDTITGKNRSILTAPLTNYNVVVVDQALGANSYVSFINTSVIRSQNSYNADVSALLTQFNNKANTFGTNISADVSQLYYSTGTDVGHRYFVDFYRPSGNYTWSLYTQGISDNFNPNDLGYLGRNNVVYYGCNQNYAIYKPFWHFNSCSSYLGFSYTRIYNPDVFYQFDISGNEVATFKNYVTAGISWDVEPIKTYDYFEPRTAGRYYTYANNATVNPYISTDYRKKFALDAGFTETSYADIQYTNCGTTDRNTFSWYLSPRFRFSDKLLMIYSISEQLANNDVGYVANDNGAIYLGTRQLTTVTNSLNASYIFTNIMSLSLSARHYWSQANYLNYRLLGNDGSLIPTTYNAAADINYNSFNMYLSFVWQYLPGSEMSVVYQNSIYTSGTDISNNYYNNLTGTLNAPQTNNLSLKLIYYLDYMSIKNTVKRYS